MPNLSPVSDPALERPDPLAGTTRDGQAPTPRVYLDYAASTPCDPAVAALMRRIAVHDFANPSSDQARDRVVRIGQTSKVRVCRFCRRGTIEESLERILRSKRELFDDAVERLAQSESATWTRVLREVGMERLLSESV